MSTPSESLFASSRHSQAFGLLAAGCVLFAIALGGSGALLSAYTGANSQTPIAHLKRVA